MDESPTLRLLPWLIAAAIWAGILASGIAHFSPSVGGLVVTVARAR